MRKSIQSLMILLFTGTAAMAQTFHRIAPDGPATTIDYLAEFQKNKFFQGVPPFATLSSSSVTIVNSGADWLLTQQFASGTFPWTVGQSTYEEDTQGGIARGMLSSYRATNNANHLNSAVQTADFLLAGYPQLFPDGDPNIAAHDPLFLEELANVTGNVQYADFVQTHFWDKLAAGVYGANNNLDAAGFADTIVGFDEYQPWVALRPWFVAQLAVAAHQAGEIPAREAFMAGMREKMEAATGSDYDGDLTGLSGAIWASALTGINLDPTAGKWASSNSTADLVTALVSYQRNGGDWPYDTSPRAAGFVGDVSVTTWSVLALDAWDSLTYASRIADGIGFIAAQQQPNGQILTNPGLQPTSNTGVEVHAEALIAMAYAGGSSNSANVNLARNQPTTASSSDGSYPPGNAGDGDMNSYWRSGSVSSNPPSWLRVDLGQEKTVGRAIVRWKSSYYAHNYELQVSNDDANWSTVYSTTEGAGGSQEFLFVQTGARYARLYMTLNHESNYRISELEIYSGTPGNVPAAPGNLAATAIGSFSIDLSWSDNASDEEGFKIERKIGDGVYSQIATTAPNVMAFSDGGLNAGTTYTYRVRAYNFLGHSNYSNETAATTVNAPPDVPGTLAATAASSTGINLSWTDAATNEDGFKIERKISGGSFSEITAVAANATTYSDNGLSVSTAYSYRVRAYNSAGDSDYSNEASATTFGSGGNPNTNLARNKPATASSTYSSYSPSRAFDGSLSSYWRSGSLSNGNQIAWLRVDLGAAQTVGRAIVRWKDNYHAKSYQLQVSADDVNWSTVYSTTAGAAGSQEFTFAPASTRYVRLYMTVKNKGNYRITELELYSSAGALVKSFAEAGESAAPETMILERAYPNPFNPATTISFALPQAAHVTLKIFDLRGHEVATLLNEQRQPGWHQIMWNAPASASGVYFAVLQAGAARQVQRLLLMK